MADLEIPQVRSMEPDERREALAAVSMGNPEHLKQWLAASDRQYVVLKSADLVDALPWPAGVEAFQQVLMAYRDHRRAIRAEGPSAQLGPEGRMKDEDLEVDELEECMGQLAREVSRRLAARGEK